MSMFGQQQGQLTPQLMHMQRLISASRPHSRASNGGSAFFGSGEQMNSPSSSSINELNEQYARHGGFGPMMMPGFPTGGAELNAFQAGFMSATTAQQGPMTPIGPFIGSVSARLPVFKCPECNIIKHSSEELEVHVKTEHLGWLPFQCPICSALRASDIQMREHIHSYHKNGENKCIYVDNPLAKRTLQEMMDRALFGASQYVQQQHAARRRISQNGSSSAKKARLENGTEEPNIKSDANSVEDEKSTIFDQMVKTEFDMPTLAPVGYSPIVDDDVPEEKLKSLNGDKLFAQRRVQRPGPSKRRVLGLCADCNKPITAGARQMHMFYHLGKDMNTYRFHCKYAGCTVQHYRKDQMENHQSKAHGKLDPNMMEDRGEQLYDLVQDMSMKLLGTTGNMPGPTAAKAQLMYEQQLREMEANLGGGRKRRRPFSNVVHSNNVGAPSIGGGTYQRPVEDLQCLLCNKFILSRTKGFHILWHLNTDLGIIRYGCKQCNFKHDRPQSVASHGHREHGVEDACEDLLYNYEEEVKTMSKKCFGVERLFEKEIRRRNKLERSAAAAVRHSVGNSVRELGIDGNNENLFRSSTWSPKEQLKKRSSGSSRSFGKRIRRPMSDGARDTMVKLREVSRRLGAQSYFRKRNNEAVTCEKCSKLVAHRLSDHAYSHMEECDLFRCQQCNFGHHSRDAVVRHIKDHHANSPNGAPMDNRLRFAQEIKDVIRMCYPRLFVDAPIPTKESIEKLKESLGLDEQQVLLVDEEEDDEEEDGEQKQDEDEEDAEQSSGQHQSTSDEGIEAGGEEVEDEDEVRDGEEEHYDDDEEEEDFVDEEEEEEEWKP